MPSAVAISLACNAWATVGQMNAALNRQHCQPAPIEDREPLGAESQAPGSTHGSA